MGAPHTFADVIAGVAAAIAAYTQALDDGRTDDVVATFCPDGMCDMPGLGRFEGSEALREAYARVAPTRPRRHLVLNTLVTEWNDREAKATSDIVLLLKAETKWVVQLVGRYHDVLHCTEGTWRFHRRVAEFID